MFRDDLIMFASEHLAGAPKAERNFVQDQQRSMPVARRAEFFQ